MEYRIAVFFSLFIFVNMSAVKQMTYKVFVYGTLKVNQPNHYYLTSPQNGKAAFVSNGTTKTKYPLIIASKYNIPFLLQSPGQGYNVKGEVYSVDELMLSKLDSLERHPHYYEREEDQIILDGTNEEVSCWVYFMKGFKKELLLKPHLQSYSSIDTHGLAYVEPSKRDPDHSTISEIKLQEYTI